MITTPYNTSNFAFTLSDEEISFFSLEDSYFNVIITIYYYSFYGSFLQSKTLEYKVLKYNNTATFKAGPKIHRNIAELTNEFQTGFQFNTAKVTFNITEVAIADDAVLDTLELLEVPFIAGKTPKLKENNTAILNTNNWYCKAGVNSICNISFLLPSQTYLINYLVNDVEITSEEITSDSLNNVYTAQINMGNFNLNIGDVLTVKIADTNLKKDFLIDKSVPNSTNIYFTNSFKLLDFIHFTGDYLFYEDPEQITQLYKNGETEQLSIVSTLDKFFLTIDTGWLYKQQLPVLNELMKSKRVLIYNLEGYNLELVPIASKRNGIDSANNSYSYSLEFRINSKTDA